MSARQEPFKKTATVFYREDKFISVQPLSGTNMVHYREDGNDWVYLEPNASDQVLGQALAAALARSRFVDDDAFYEPDRAMRVYANWETDFMNRYGYKTKHAAYKNLGWCLARVFDGKVSIQPHRYEKMNTWRSLPADRTVVVPASDDAAALGAALRLALDRCE
ncbi:MAG TPA: contact-dependent growth inhibition system immunity protein [Terriglobales bacterium]|nr:contact-dependent growth inhibition system immunity protein [Terriglobales bacterium]